VKLKPCTVFKLFLNLNEFHYSYKFYPYKKKGSQKLNSYKFKIKLKYNKCKVSETIQNLDYRLESDTYLLWKLYKWMLNFLRHDQLLAVSFTLQGIRPTTSASLLRIRSTVPCLFRWTLHKSTIFSISLCFRILFILQSASSTNF